MLFQHFADVGQRIGVYGLRDYANNVEGFIGELELEQLGGLDGDAAQHRDEICALPGRYRAQAGILDRKRARPVAFGWIHGRAV